MGVSYNNIIIIIANNKINFLEFVRENFKKYLKTVHCVEGGDIEEKVMVPNSN